MFCCSEANYQKTEKPDPDEEAQITNVRLGGVVRCAQKISELQFADTEEGLARKTKLQARLYLI